MARRRTIAALAALAALSLAACSSSDADEGDVVDAMTDAGLPTDQAECVGERFIDEFNQEQLNDLAAADDPADFPEGTEEEVQTILERCTGEETSTSSDTSETTEGATTSTTAAG